MEEVSSAEKWGDKWHLGLTRPWIITDDYQGPDRRRNVGSPPPSGERRHVASHEEISLDDFKGQDVLR